MKANVLQVIVKFMQLNQLTFFLQIFLYQLKTETSQILLRNARFPLKI